MAGDGGLVPSSNRGLKGGEGQQTRAALVDFLTFTAPTHVVPGKKGEAFATSAFEFYLGDTPLHLDGQARGGQNFYEISWRIVSPDGKACGFVAVGGNRGTFCIELTGVGCSYVGDWKRIADRIEGTGATLTRVDCAHDDFSGTHPVRWALDTFNSGGFGRGGRPPKGEFLDDLGSNKGCTLYVGKNSGNQTLCVYEKGKQLGDVSSPWVRYEGRFGAKYRPIPYDVLRRPGEFLAGMWACLGWISEVADKFATAARKVACSMLSLASHLKRQYGRFIHFAKSIHSDPAEFAEWVASIARPGLPEKLRLPHVASVMGADVVRQQMRSWQLCAS